MTKATALTLSLAIALVSVILIANDTSDTHAADAKKSAKPGKPKKVGHPTFMSPHSRPIAIYGDRVFVANTPSDTLDIIHRKSRKVVARVPVGVDPVSVAVRPDGKEVWVSNHVSDSVSVVDVDPQSPTNQTVVATIQQFDRRTKATRFDEPVGIAFAGNEKAYIALSSENIIAVVDATTRKVTKRLRINAQDPRAIRVHGDRLYVIPFESNNQTQLSGGGRGKKFDGKLVTFDAHRHSIARNNVLSLGHVVDIVKHPRVPDRDLYVFDTETDKLLQTVDTLGTLLYGMTVDSKGQVFIAQTDARNDANGRSGTKKHGLKEMENRAFLNRITKVGFKDGKAGKPKFFDLEPLPPQHPKEGEALATPFAIQISQDDKTLVVSAAGSDKVFTVDAASGNVLGRVTVGAVPRGIALESNKKSAQAWVLNAVDNTISVVDLSDAAKPKVVGSVTLHDPTHPTVKRGRIAFNKAAASTTNTFACASCHPDGHTDQLLWVLATPIVTGGNQIMPRSTMPIRGLRDTEPYHWDGIPGDPYGGINSANIRKHVPPNSKRGVPETSTRHLIDGGLANTMATVGDKTKNDEGKSGKLTKQERDDMAKFLLAVPYPPAQRRAYDNVVTKRGKRGFHLFHIDGDLQGRPKPNVCGDCHRMPFWVSTNTPGTGMDAPTWRGAYDRFLILPQGRLNIIDFDFYRRQAERGQPEREIWRFSWAGRRRFDPIWEMVVEGSTGYSGSFARQVTLSKQTADQGLTKDLLSALETSAREGGVILEGEGVYLGKKPIRVALQFDGGFNGGSYVSKTGKRKAFTRAQLVAAAKAGKFVGTFTARHGAEATVDDPQPGIWTLSSLHAQSGRQVFPILHKDNQRMTIHGRHLKKGARVYVDGRRVRGKVALQKKERLTVELAKLPGKGMHLLQLQNPNGQFTNDFIFHVTEDAKQATILRIRLDRAHIDARDALGRAVATGNIRLTREVLGRRSRGLKGRRRREGSTALSTAALHGHTDIAKLLIRRGAKVGDTNRDGNTPLHVAAFLCRDDIVKLLLEKGASPQKKNRRGETPIDVVSSKWSKQLAAFYTGIARSSGFKVDLKKIEAARPKIAKLLKDHAKKK